MSGPYKPGSGFKPPSSYGWRTDPFDASKREFHAGQDFGARAGTPISAATSGVVVYSGYNEGYGNVVIVKNDTGEYSLYAHMQDGDRVAPGQRIWLGDMIGRVGSTGSRSKAPHLHYSVINQKDGDNVFVKKDQLGNGDPADRYALRNAGHIGLPVNEKTTVNPAAYDDYDPTPRYQAETNRALRIMVGTDASAGVGDGRSLGRLQSPPTTAPVPYLDQTSTARQHYANVPAVPAPADPSGGGGPAGPWTDDNLPRSFDGRFGTGSWPPLAPAGPPLSREPKKDRRTEALDGPPSTPASFPAPASTFGRLLMEAAHRAANVPPPSAAAPSPPLAPTVPTGPDLQPSFENQPGSSTSAQAFPPKVDPHFRQLSSPILPLGWSLSPSVAPDQAQPQPDATSGDDLHEWFARWIRSFNR